MKKILILTMSCNQPYYQALLGAVRNTWARPLIKNKYPDVTWFSYTSCDNKHPKPMIDFENHMIYVDVPDDREHVYEKTRKAYDMVKNIIKFDYVIRTNTTVFVNINKLIERVNELPDNYIIGNWSQWTYEDGDFQFWLLIGFFFGMNKHLFDIAMIPGDDVIRYKDGSIRDYSDDLIISQKIKPYIFNEYTGESIHKDHRLPLYKSFIKGDYFEIFDQPHNFLYTDDPNIVNDYVAVRTRTLYNGEDRTTKGHEIEHMYELDSALNN